MKVFTVAASAAIAAAGAGFYATAFHPTMKERAELSAQLAAQQKTNAMLEAQIAELRRRQNDFRTDEQYVELEARRAGLTRPNETVFDFSVGGNGR